MRVTKKTAKKQPKAKAEKKAVKSKPVKAKTAQKPKAKNRETAGPITVEFERAELEKTLAIARDFVDKKTTMPILAHIYLGITDAGCRVIGTNLDRWWTKEINCKTGAPVNRCVPLELLYSEVKVLQADITLAELRFEENTVSVNNRCSIHTLPASDYPAVPKGGGTKTEITGLIEKSTRVFPAIGDSDTRYTLNALCFDLAKGVIAGTDGHRLHYDDIEAYMDSPQILIPGRTIALAIKHKASETVQYDKEYITFQLASGIMISRLIEGTYPNYENVIPRNNPISVKFRGTDLLKILEGAIPVASERTKAVRLTINGQIVVESMNDGIGHYKWHVACETKGNNGKDLVIGFNAQFLAEAVKSYITKEDDSVIMELNEPLSPALLNSKAVVMPMRT